METRIQKNGQSSVVFYSRKLAEKFDIWNKNFVTRKQLGQLDDNLLRDIGIDKVTADKEASKPFWRV